MYIPAVKRLTFSFSSNVQEKKGKDNLYIRVISYIISKKIEEIKNLVIIIFLHIINQVDMLSFSLERVDKKDDHYLLSITYFLVSTEAA